jgi:hypothetical protein
MNCFSACSSTPAVPCAPEAMFAPGGEEQHPPAERAWAPLDQAPRTHGARSILRSRWWCTRDGGVGCARSAGRSTPQPYRLFRFCSVTAPRTRPSEAKPSKRCGWSARSRVGVEQACDLSHGGSQGFKSPHLHPATDDQQQRWSSLVSGVGSRPHKRFGSRAERAAKLHPYWQELLEPVGKVIVWLWCSEVMAARRSGNRCLVYA